MSDRFWRASLGLGAFLLYLSLLAKSYVFEGLARAMPIELGQVPELFKGTYLLYGALGYAFHHALGAFGAHPPAFLSLQVLDAVLGAAGLIVFFQSLRDLGLPSRQAACWSAALGLSLGYCLWSTDAQNYIFSTFLLSLHWLLLCRLAAGKTVSPLLLGATHALAVFGHLVNAMLLFPTLFLLWRVHGKAWRRPALRYAAVAAAAVMAVYALVLGLIVRPSSLAELRLWLIGSLATSQGEANWHGGLSAGSVWLWLKMTLNIFVSKGPEYPLGTFAGARVMLWTARLLLAGLAIQTAKTLPRMQGKERNAAQAALVWLAAFAAVFTSWEPGTMVYRVSDLVPLIALLALGVESLPQAYRLALPAAFAAVLAAGNLTAEVHPRSLAGNNPRLSRMEFIKAHTPEGSWVTVGLGDAGNDELYLPYFAQRRPILWGRYEGREAALSNQLDKLVRSGAPVFATSRALREPGWQKVLAPFAPAETAKDSEGLVLYQLRPRAPHLGL